jgi:glutaredoxin
MAAPLRVTLYKRDACHLCEEARALLDAMLGVEGYRRVDIDADNELVLRYGFRVPVLAVDGIDRLEAPITGPDLRAVLGEAGIGYAG